jgi:hypothetical protein
MTPRQKSRYTWAMRVLHECPPAREFIIEGYEAMAEYLNQIGWRQKDNKPVTVRAVMRWRFDKGFPVFRPGARHQKLYTINLLVLAWLYSLGGQRRDMWGKAGFPPWQKGHKSWGKGSPSPTP